jgi:F0F1-type ATP synthase assembly protein I
MNRFLAWRDRQYRDLRQVAVDAKEQRAATRAHLFALEIPFSVIVGAVLGSAIDERWDSAPWGFAVFLLAGIAAAVRTVVRLVRFQHAVDRQSEQDGEREQEQEADASTTTGGHDGRL